MPAKKVNKEEKLKEYWFESNDFITMVEHWKVFSKWLLRVYRKSLSDLPSDSIEDVTSQMSTAYTYKNIILRQLVIQLETDIENIAKWLGRLKEK